MRFHINPPPSRLEVAIATLLIVLSILTGYTYGKLINQGVEYHGYPQ